MRHVPWHVKGTRAAPRDAAGDAARRSGISITAAFAMIRKEIQELRRETSRPQVEPAAFEQQLHDLATQIGALQGMAGGGADPGPGQDAFLTQLKALLAQNLLALQRQVATTAADAISGPAESIRRDVASLKEVQASVDRRTQDTFEAVYGTIERIVDRLAAIEDELRERPSGPPADGARLPPVETPSADDGERAGAPDVRPVRAAEVPDLVRGSGQNLAADGAWQTVMLRQPAVVPDVAVETGPRQDFVKPEQDLRASSPATRSGGLVAAARRALVGKMAIHGALIGTMVTPRSRLERWLGPLRPHWKTAVLGLGAALLMLFSLTLAIDLYSAPAEPVADPIYVAGTGLDAAGRPDDERVHGTDPSPGQPSGREKPGEDPGTDADKGPGKESDRDASLKSSPPPAGEVTTAAPSEPPTTAAPAEPSTTAASLRIDTSAPWDADTLMRNVLLPTPPEHAPWPQAQSGPSAQPDLAATPLPPAIGSKGLLAAAQAGNPAAAYEVAIRFMQGRNATADAGKAAAWLERAVQAGFAPAQFRLGGMYEKGNGVRKNLAEARRLYLAAAAKGYAKAMHNLAVLYTHGVGSAPDYGAAAEWFRKAASYGTVDSQYNLGILYARGAGVERDLVESYKWFTLAAKGGDKDAARKRDEIAKGLDPKQLESARADAEAFVAMPQPEEATAPKAPAGGWDQAAATATTKSRTVAKSERFPGK